jgi:hypothetical protein
MTSTDSGGSEERDPLAVLRVRADDLVPGISDARLRDMAAALAAAEPVMRRLRERPVDPIAGRVDPAYGDHWVLRGSREPQR